MKKIIFVIISALIPLLLIVALIFAVIVACLLILDFFGTSSTDGYVENNMDYAEDYINVLNENITNGYVSLERILYFYLANDTLSFDKIYNDNLDLEVKRMKPISDVCSLLDYRRMSICTPQEIRLSNQQDTYSAKPFSKPIDFEKATITSFFMEQRILFGSLDVHKAWDLAAPEQTDVYSVCDGEVIKVSYPYSENISDTAGGLGNHIVIKCNLDNTIYKVTYGHLYPSDSLLTVGDMVLKNQIIGNVGNTGSSTGNHLHYQVQLENNTYVDGMSFIDFTDGSVTEEPENPGYNPGYELPEIGPNYGY